MPRKKQLPAQIEQVNAEVVDDMPKVSLKNLSLITGIDEWYNEDHDIDSYSKFRRYVSKLMNAVRIGAIPREVANAQIYAGSMLLLGLDREREFGDPLSQLPEHLRGDKPLEVSLTIDEAKELLQIQDKGAQIKWIRKKAEQGFIVEAEVTDKTEEVAETAVVADPDRDEKTKQLLKMIATGAVEAEIEGEAWF